MIKRFRFGTSSAPRPAPGVLRTVSCAPVEASAAAHAYTVQWFDDRSALTAYEAQLEAEDKGSIVIAEEVVQRGADWLTQRWSGRDRKWKHVALARRADGLDREEFAERWKRHAGSATTKQAASTPIPEAARGRAYVQNHPLPGAEWPFDAITEVWFDDLDAMQARVEWFRDNVVPDELFGSMTFVAVEEEILRT